MPPVTRVVQIQFKDGVDADRRKTVRVIADAPKSIATQREPLTVNICYIKVLDKVRAMKVNCLSRQTGQSYIQFIRVGKDVSPEPLNNGSTHQFILEFNSEADRDYYSSRDPAHQAVIAGLGPVLEKIQILDIIDGEI
ncbi:stress responsive A/B barrel domain-containing protein [Aspergillus pseudodeflectus]|uniref:Stress responsive A/B barrel domain-containing protein n=1 Tax=Aspergillus pseudodeflectus TaxID=176178 RepID=A0ABR4JZ72_9EURO